MAATFFSSYPNQQAYQPLVSFPMAAPRAPAVTPGVSGGFGVSGGSAPFLSAKDIQYKQPGSVSNFYGMTPENVFAPGQFLDKFYNDAVKGGITTGGNEGILKTLRTTDYGGNAQQNELLQQYLNTGQVPAGLDPNYAIGNYDYAIREQGRQQQTKSPSLLGSVLKSFIGPTIGALALGPAGLGLSSAAFGGALGGAIQGGVSDGPRGAVLGGIGGYGIGSGVNSLSNFASSLGGGGFANPSALGLSGSNLSLPGLAFGPGSTAVSGYGASALGLNGASLALPGLVNAAQALSIPGYGASAVGGDAASLYSPVALSGKTNALGISAGDAAGPLRTIGSALDGAQQPTTFNATDAFTAEPTSMFTPLSASGGSNPLTDRFNYALADALTGNAGRTQNAAAVGGMGAGLIAPSQRDLQRNPGYQPRPFANYLMRQ